MTTLTNIPLSARLKSIPGFFGLRFQEEPKYFVLLKEENKQIRKYQPFLIAETFVRGDYEYASNEAFYRLTNYIFGHNDLNEKMAMTAPVFQARSKKLVMASPVLQERRDDGWMMSFVLPTKYKLNAVPKPLMNNIEIIRIPSLTVAALRYSGVTNVEKFDQKSQELLSWVESQKDYTVKSEARCAQYNAPFVLPIFRRNEIQFTLVEKDKKKKVTQ